MKGVKKDGKVNESSNNYSFLSMTSLSYTQAKPKQFRLSKEIYTSGVVQFIYLQNKAKKEEW